MNRVLSGLRRKLSLTPSQARFALLLTIVLVIGLILQILLMLNQWADWDEGSYMAGALAIAHGGFPLVTFSSRVNPLLLFALAPAVYVFGGNLIVGRSVIILFNLGTAIVLALLARRFVKVNGDVAGLATAAIYLMSPYVTSVDVTIHQEPLAAFFVVTSLYFLLRVRWHPSAWNYPVAGLLLACAILSRRSAVVIGFVWLIWMLYTESSWRSRVLTNLKCFVPGIALFLGFFAYVAARTSVSWTVTSLVRAADVPYGQYAVPLPIRLEIFGYLLLVAVPLFMVPMALLVRHLRSMGREQVAWLAAILFTSVIFSLLAAYTYLASWGIGEIIIPNLPILLVVSAAIWFVLLGMELTRTPGSISASSEVMVLVAGWGIVFVFMDFLPRPQDFVAYGADAAAPLSLLFGYWFSTLLPKAEAAPEPGSHEKPRRSAFWSQYALPTLVVFALVLSSAMTALYVYGPTNPENVPGATKLAAHSVYVYPPSQINAVASKLKSLVGANDTVFSFDALFLTAAGIGNSPEISAFIDPYVSMLWAHTPNNVPLYAGAPNEMAPSIDSLLSYWNDTRLGWVVQGYLTTEALSYSPLLTWYFSTYFHPVASFGDPLSYDEVLILERGAPPVPTLAQKASVTSSSESRALAEANGTIYSASMDSPYLSFVTSGGVEGQLGIAFQGALGLGSFFGDLWVGSSTTPQIEIMSPNGTGGEVVNVGNAPSTFVGDPATGMVFVSTFTSATVTALALDSNHTWWHVAWTVPVGELLTSLAVNENSRELYVASAGTDSIMTLDEINGTVIENASLSFPPISISYVDSGIDAAWFNGWVYHLGIEPNGSMQVFSSTLTGGGVWKLVTLPSINAIAVSSAVEDTITVLDASTLAVLGVFRSVSCPNSLLWDESSGVAATTEDCGNVTNIWQVPAPALVTLTGASGQFASLSTSPQVWYELPVTLHLWPQIITVEANLTGYLPGYSVLAVEPGEVSLALTVTMGPSLSGIQNLQLDFAVEIIALSILAFAGAMVLIFRSGRFVEERI